MILPPAILRLSIVDNGRRVIGLWLPLFLLWPLMLAVVAALPVLMAVGLFIPRRMRLRRALLSSWWWVTAFCALRGLRIDVKDRADRVYIEAF